MASYIKVSSDEGSAKSGDLEEGGNLIVAKEGSTTAGAAEGDDAKVRSATKGDGSISSPWQFLILQMTLLQALSLPILCYGPNIAKSPLFVATVVSVLTLAGTSTFHEWAKENVAKSTLQLEESAIGSKNCYHPPS
jgi:hypothetical protein